MRGRETVSRRAHNPKAGGSTPSPATNKYIPNNGMSSNGRTTDSDSVYLGSNPNVPSLKINQRAEMVELVDTPGLEPGAARRAGSSPVLGKYN